MANKYANGHSSTEHTVRNAADDALCDRAYQQLIEATYELTDYYAVESRLVVLALGRLGMRVGELIHIQESWIDWRNRMIEIPAHEPCEKGKDGGPCGYCLQLAAQKAAYNEDMSEDRAIAERWEPKTDAAARAIPFDFHPQTELVIEEYFDRFELFQTSKSGVNRRLDRVCEHVDDVDSDEIYPHCLRATAASYHASRGLDAITLQSLLGWACLGTAHRYVRRSGERTQKALNAIHSR